MKYLCLAFLLSGIVCHLYSAEVQERHLQDLIGIASIFQKPLLFDNEFEPKWEQTLEQPLSNVRFLPPLNQKELFDKGRGTIVVGLGKQVITMDVRGQILQRFSMAGFDVQNVKYIEEKDGRDVIAVTSLDASTNRLKLSVFGMKKIKMTGRL